MCKPHKGNGMPDEKEVSKCGFGKLRKLRHAKKDLKDWASNSMVE